MKTAIIALCCTCFLIELPIQCFVFCANSFDTSERASCSFNRCKCFGCSNHCFFKIIVTYMRFQKHTFSEAMTFRQSEQLFHSTGKLLRGKSNWHYLTTISLSRWCLYWTDTQHVVALMEMSWVAATVLHQQQTMLLNFGEFAVLSLMTAEWRQTQQHYTFNYFLDILDLRTVCHLVLSFLILFFHVSV